MMKPFIPIEKRNALIAILLLFDRTIYEAKEIKLIVWFH